MFIADSACRVCGAAVPTPEHSPEQSQEAATPREDKSAPTPVAAPADAPAPAVAVLAPGDAELLAGVLRELQAIRGSVGTLAEAVRALRLGDAGAAPAPSRHEHAGMSPVVMRPYEPGLFEALADWRLSKYLTRRVLAVVYTLMFVISVLAIPAAAYLGYELLRGTCLLDSSGSQVCSGLAPAYAWGAVPASLLAWIPVVTLLRLLFEWAAAPVVVAQNTGPLYER